METNGSALLPAYVRGAGAHSLLQIIMKISGKICKVLPLQEGVSSQGAQWRKQSIVVVEDDANIAFPNEVVFDLFNDRIPETQLTVGQRVDVHFGIRTREYKGKIYNDINVVKITMNN